MRPLVSGLAVLSCVAVSACISRTLEPPALETQQAERDTFTQNPSLQLDIVFLIDNSDSMGDEQANLIRNFPRFMQVLEGAVPSGQVLDAHIGVLSSDLGIASAGISNCDNAGGDNGIFQSAPRGGCTAAPRGSYLVSGPGGNNFDGTMAEAFSCIAALGTGGCGFEHQLASIRRALGGDPAVGAPEENAGFLRRDARLGIVVVTDEDDCSAPAGSDLFRTEDRLLTDPYGPVDSYRCNEFGHLCGGQPPPRGTASGLLDCHSNETDGARLVKVGDFVSFLRTLKPDPAQLRVAVVAGPASPYATTLQPGATGDVVQVTHSCTGANGAADPAVRLADLVDRLGTSGLYETICADDFGPAMQHIAEALIEPKAGCLRGEPVDRDPAMPGLQPDCTVSQTHRTGDGTAFEVAVPGCDSTAAGSPCWRLAPDARCAAAPGNLAVVVDQGPGLSAPPNTRTAWSCRVEAR